MSDVWTFESVREAVQGKSLDEISEMVESDPTLSTWVRLRSGIAENAQAGADSDCEVWIYDPDRGWVCARHK